MGDTGAVRGPNVLDLKGFFTGERDVPLWMKLILVVPGVQITLVLYDRRGIALAVLGAALWSGFLVLALRGSRGASAWSRAHPAMDAAMTVPIVFVALAYLTRLELWWCALIGVALWLVVVVLGRWRRRVVPRGRAGID